MTTTFDIYNSAFIYLRTYIMIALSNKRQGCKHIQTCNCLGCTLDSYHFLANFITDIGKQLVFQGIKFIFSAKDHIFKVFQLLGNITLCICKSLFTDVVLRHQFFKRIGYLKGIAEYTVIFNLQGFDSGTLTFLCFQLCKPFFSICAGTAEFIHIFVKAFTNNASILLGKGRFIYNGVLDQICNIFKTVHVLVDFFQNRCLKVLENLFNIRNHFQRGRKCYHISWICRLKADAADQTLQVIHWIEIFPDLIAEHRFLIQLFKSFQSAIDLFCIDQWLFHKGAKSTGTHGCFSLIQYPEKRTSFLLFTEGLHQLQISSAGAVNQHITLCRIRTDGSHLRKCSLLRFLKIQKQRSGSYDSTVIIADSKAFQIGYVKMFP